MNDLQTIALAKAAEKFAKDIEPPEPGLHAVDFLVTVRVMGSLEKQPDTEQQPAAAISGKAAAALCAALKSAGVSRPQTRSILIKVMTPGAEAEGKKTDEDLLLATKEVEDLLATLPAKSRAGALKAQLQLTELRSTQTAAA